MKNRINLYAGDLKPKLELVTFGFVSGLWGLLVIVGVAGFLWVDNENGQIDSNLNSLQVQVDAKSKVVESLNKDLDNMQPSKSLIDEIESLKVQIKVKQKISQELKGKEGEKSQGFSSLMLDLAAHSQQDVWLTRISIVGEQVELEGGAANSEALPKWVSVLSNSRNLSGQEFGNARLFRDDDETLRFFLSSEIVTEASTSASQRSQLEVNNGE